MPDSPQPPRPPDDRLESWKEIAAYLKKGVRTVQRWERTDGLPVRRLGQDRAGLVFAYKSEIDAWWEKQSRTVAAEPELEPESKAEPRRSSFRWWPIAVVVALAGTAGAVWKLRPESPSPRRAVPITADHGWEASASFSPDGRRIVYMARPPGALPQLYVKSLDSDAKTQLTSDTSFSPAWSPDGRWIACLRYSSDARRFNVILIPATGGAERQLSLVGVGSDLAWSSDSRWLVAGDGEPKQRTLVAIDTQTGAKHTIIGPTEFGFVGFGLTPDSKRLVYALGAPGAVAVQDLALGPGLIPAGNPRPITGRHWILHMRVAADGESVVYVDGSWEEGSLRRLRLQSGAQPEVLYSTSERILSAALSQDGQNLVFALGRGSREEIWKLSIEDKQAAPFLTSTHADMNPQYSPDGRWIAFHSTRAGSSDIWISDLNGANLRRLTYTKARTTATPRWSPDGQWVAFESTLAGQSEVYVIPSHGGQLRRLTNNPALDAIPSWSRDGRSIYFCSDRTGRFEVWRMPAAGGDPVQVTKDGGFVAVESVDRQHLYFSRTRNHGPLLRMPIGGGPAEEIAPDIRGLFFAVTDRGVYYIVRRVLSFWDSASRRTEPVYELPKPSSVGLDVSPDGKTILFTQMLDEQAGADLYLITGLR